MEVPPNGFLRISSSNILYCADTFFARMNEDVVVTVSKCYTSATFYLLYICLLRFETFFHRRLTETLR